MAREEPHTCPKCGSQKLHRDEDTLDTWFSSALWPFSTLGAPGVGRIRYKDLNGDNIINTADMDWQGSDQPKFIGGLNIGCLLYTSRCV